MASRRKNLSRLNKYTNSPKVGNRAIFEETSQGKPFNGGERIRVVEGQYIGATGTVKRQSKDGMLLVDLDEQWFIDRQLAKPPFAARIFPFEVVDERCTCPTTCNCQLPPELAIGGVARVSEECPVHNRRPIPSDDCPIHSEE